MGRDKKRGFIFRERRCLTRLSRFRPLPNAPPEKVHRWVGNGPTSAPEPSVPSDQGIVGARPDEERERCTVLVAGEAAGATRSFVVDWACR